jgi:hypothetical protein
MNIRESLTDGNMPISKASIMKNLQKVAKLAPVTEAPKPKASKSLTETIMENINASPAEVITNPLNMGIGKSNPNKAGAALVKKPLNTGIKSNPNKNEAPLKEFFKSRLNSALSENSRDVTREIAMFGKPWGGRGQLRGDVSNIVGPSADPYGRAEARRNMEGIRSGKGPSRPNDPSNRRFMKTI